MKIGFYPINDPKKELITSGVFPSMNSAIKIFAQMKNLSPVTFLEIYGVRKLEN
tara:strand:- start:232 stop:393 length:162 start_codon:yes stop_codon:yes gene_type:complete